MHLPHANVRYCAETNTVETAANPGASEQGNHSNLSCANHLGLLQAAARDALEELLAQDV